MIVGDLSVFSCSSSDWQLGLELYAQLWKLRRRLPVAAGVVIIIFRTQPAWMIDVQTGSGGLGGLMLKI
jgi:hypothetical protein